MKQLVGLVIGVFIAIIVAHPTDLEEWNAYKLKYGKSYQNETEEEIRMEIFLKNKDKVEEHNENHSKGLVSYKMGLNQFSDLSPDEMSNRMKGLRPSDRLASRHISNRTITYNYYSRHHRHHHKQHLPDSIDWRDEGAVNSVADTVQGDCGSCWAFTTTGAIEGQFFRKTGKLIQLSAQNLIDCVIDCGCSGCSLTEAYYYAQDHGVDKIDQYPEPYTGRDGMCEFDSTDSIRIKSFDVLPHNDEDKLREAIALIGPISIEIDADNPSFSHYSSGVYYEPECSSHNLNHGVLAVGYGTTEDGEDYYILKNWWDEDWGEGGYFKLARNRNNHCGVAKNAYYPIL